ncbi:hypothetical protein DSO57_1000897 [Entomophthora muscae]|uniref:Uncharacterized protein n=1 Tax=Entomophthora muscae TaxID=34485 RepID=A0ACC2SYE7_9FUNG|nr:hypothetical protein DSO57_1000897 [Entomophthora muscae]
MINYSRPIQDLQYLGYHTAIQEIPITIYHLDVTYSRDLPSYQDGTITARAHVIWYLDIRTRKPIRSQEKFPPCTIS